jgi:hypothetical protein
MSKLILAAMLLVMAAANTPTYAADARVLITICNTQWSPPCRDFPVTTAVPVSEDAAPAAAANSYSVQLKGLNDNQLQKVFSMLGIDKNQVNLSAK